MYCRILVAVLGASTAIWLAGCPSSDSASDSDRSPDEPTSSDDHGHDHGHDHPDHGPHGGDLIELGNEEYHAELVHDEEAGTITIYVLDGSAAKTVAIDAAAVTINLVHEGTPEQYALSATPGDGDAEGKSSRFVSEDEALERNLHAATNPRLSLKIDGKPYSGDIVHDHDHGDSHSHDDALVWRLENVSHNGFVIHLGHHASHLHAGERVEPAVSVTLDGEPVADAEVFNALVSTDGTAVVAEEVATVYEPTTDEEPAHYAQGELLIPPSMDKIAIRYRIVLPGDGGELTKDVTIELE